MPGDVKQRAPIGLRTEADAYELLERLRWGDDGPTQCPHCESDKGAWFLKPKDPAGRKAKGGSEVRSPRRVWKCRENTCRRQFSVLTNTALHSTKMPVRAWVGAIVDLCSEPSGVSARDIARRWGVTEKAAWTMLMRLQDALWSPEAAGASLASNAPLWFEVQPDQNPAGGGRAERREIDVARAEAERAAARLAADRVQADVRRALAEADASPAQTSEATPPSAPAAAARTSLGRSADGIDAAAQVRSDVERALAEAFAEPINSAEAPAANRTPAAARETGDGENADALGARWLDAVDSNPDPATPEQPRSQDREA